MGIFLIPKNGWVRSWTSARMATYLEHVELAGGKKTGRKICLALPIWKLCHQYSDISSQQTQNRLGENVHGEQHGAKRAAGEGGGEGRE